jgi:hypothetical protein
MSTGKPPPRFVPTLTEVFHPGEEQQPAPIDAQTLVEQVLQAVKPRLEQQLRATLQAAVEEQMRVAVVGWERDIHTAVQTAVARALASQLPKP